MFVANISAAVEREKYGMRLWPCRFLWWAQPHITARVRSQAYGHSVNQVKIVRSGIESTDLISLLGFFSCSVVVLIARTTVF